MSRAHPLATLLAVLDSDDHPLAVVRHALCRYFPPRTRGHRDWFREDGPMELLEAGNRERMRRINMAKELAALRKKYQ